MKPIRQFDLTPRSVIVRSDKPTKGLDAKQAPNPNQMHRLYGYLADGSRCVIAQRHGKGGMDFNKLLGGKVFAVAADGFSPVYVKGPDKKPTKEQQSEDGLPAYSASGFYLLSSKDYPALDMFEGYCLLLDNGHKMALITDAQLAARGHYEVGCEMDLDLLDALLEDLLADQNNLVARFDADINKKRERGVRRAKEEAEDANEHYSGVEFEPLAVSKKDGNPLVAFVCGEHRGLITREIEAIDEDSGQVRVRYMTAAEAVEHFKASPAYAQLRSAAQAEQSISFDYCCGHLMRSSISFKRKCENVVNATREAPTKPVYGDGVFILGALQGWCRAIVSVMHSQHPNFPASDYEAHHYVCAARQAEIGMDKKDGGGWTVPVAVHYDLHQHLTAKGTF